MKTIFSVLASALCSLISLRAETPSAPPVAGGNAAEYEPLMAKFRKTVADRITEDGAANLTTLGVSGLLAEDSFQKEVLAYLQKEAPKALEGAKKSSGNMHNPKMETLREPFAKAVVASQAAKQINKMLATYGLKITGADFEKFRFEKVEGGRERRFECFLWLTVGPIKQEK